MAKLERYLAMDDELMKQGEGRLLGSHDDAERRRESVAVEGGMEEDANGKGTTKKPKF